MSELGIRDPEVLDNLLDRVTSHELLSAIVPGPRTALVSKNLNWGLNIRPLGQGQTTGRLIAFWLAVGISVSAIVCVLIFISSFVSPDSTGKWLVDATFSTRSFGPALIIAVFLNIGGMLLHELIHILTA